MAGNSTPENGTPQSTPPPGTGAPESSGSPGTNTQGTPQVPTDPSEASKYWEARHKEATEKIRVQGTELSTLKGQAQESEKLVTRYKDTYGELEEPTPPPPETPVDTPMTQSQFRDWELDQKLDKVPSLKEYKPEIAELVGKGLPWIEARDLVAKRHNVTLGPTSGNLLDTMPQTPSGGGGPVKQDFTPEELEQMRIDGIDPEVAKKHKGAVQGIWNKALKR